VSYAGGTSYNDINLLNGIWFNCSRIRHVERMQLSYVLRHLAWRMGVRSLSIGKTVRNSQHKVARGERVVAKYPNGQPAIIQGFAGKGWTLLQGVHPEAPRSWGCGYGCTCDFGTTTEAEDFAYSATLINAALKGTVLQHF